ncbi:MAG: YihY/virulence factor BrkB family protein [Bacteroidetes bacterium]|nr:YihY/virulence factor BrkB family protein [Bacteroidota bacterium]
MVERFKGALLKSYPVRFVLTLSKKLILPGFEGLPFYDVASFFFIGVQNGSLTTRASSLAFKFFLAIFPSIIFLITLIPYIPINDFQDQLLILMKDFLPSNAYEAMRETFEDLVKHQRGDLLSFGFLFALYLATDGIHAMISAFNKSNQSIETRSIWKIRLISVALVFILTFLILIAIALIVFSNVALDYLVSKHLLVDSLTIYLLLIGKWFVILGLFFCAFSFLYYLGPDQKLKWKFISAGSTFATVMSIIASLGFSFYVNHFGNYNKLYGSIGTLIVIMLWIYFNAIIILLGFELNASIHSAKLNRRK